MGILCTNHYNYQASGLLSVNFDDFKALLRCNQIILNKHTVKRLFNVMDVSNSGGITPTDLEKFVSMMGFSKTTSLDSSLQVSADATDTDPLRKMQRRLEKELDGGVRENFSSISVVLRLSLLHSHVACLHAQQLRRN